MCGGDGVEVADDWWPLMFRCPYCFKKGFSLRAKLGTPFGGNIVCRICGEASRTREGFLFGGIAYLAFFGGVIGALVLVLPMGPYPAFAAFALYCLLLYAMGRLMAPVQRLDAPYLAGLRFGRLVARLFGSIGKH